jgi:all-trans-retinol dehydrogenase (NAD+)
VDVLVNNAGVVVGKPILDLTPEEIERTFRINALAHFWTIKAFLPGMIAADSGHIVTMASAAGICAVPRLADYSASKAALIALDEALRLELRRARSHVRTTVVCPFYVATGMFAGAKTRWPLLLPILRPEDVAARVVGAIQNGRRRVIVPRIVGLTFLARLFPVHWFDAGASFLGVSASMDEFVGHAGASPPSSPRRITPPVPQPAGRPPSLQAPSPPAVRSSPPVAPPSVPGPSAPGPSARGPR